MLEALQTSNGWLMGSYWKQYIYILYDRVTFKLSTFKQGVTNVIGESNYGS
jgi:hypothetical protein